MKSQTDRTELATIVYVHSNDNKSEAQEASKVAYPGYYPTRCWLGEQEIKEPAKLPESISSFVKELLMNKQQRMAAKSPVSSEDNELFDEYE
jgi:hypothetical protein